MGARTALGIRSTVLGSALLLASLTPAAGQDLDIQGSFDKKLLPAPANLTLTFVPGGRDSFQGDLAARLTWATAASRLGPSVEYHRNTAATKEIDQFKAGLSGEHQVGDLADASTSVVPFLLWKTNYARDGMKETDALQASVLVSGIWRGRGFDPAYFYRPGVTSRFPGFEFVYEPNIGLEWQYSGEGESSPSGTVARAVADVRGLILPFPTLLKRKVALSAGYTYRNVFLDEDALEDAHHDLSTASVEWAFLGQAGGLVQEESAGLVLSYRNGSDPASGKPDQEFTQLAFSIRW